MRHSQAETEKVAWSHPSEGITGDLDGSLFKRSITYLKVVSNLFEGELIINHSKDWQLWRGEIKTGNRHAHFNTKSALDKFLKLIYEGIMPTSEHYITSAKRLFTDEELGLLKTDHHKERYHNKIKNLRKQRKVFKYR